MTGSSINRVFYDVETYIDAGFPRIGKKHLGRRSIWFENGEWFVRHGDDDGAWIWEINDAIEALLIFYGIYWFNEERNCAASKYGIHLYRKLL